MTGTMVSGVPDEWFPKPGQVVEKSPKSSGRKRLKLSMNNIRRKRLNEAITYINKAKDIIDDVASEEEDAFDGLSDGLQQTERGERIEENANDLADIVDSLDEIIDSIHEVIM